MIVPPNTQPQEPSETQIKALIRLLSDSNKQVSTTIHNHLVSLGPPALPYLQQAECDDPHMAQRLAQVIQDIQFTDLEHTLQQAAHPEMDLEHGAFLLAKIAYPNLDPDPYISQLETMASDIGARIRSDLSGKESIVPLIHYVFEEKGFRGNTEDYYDPENSFLHRVLDRRLGIPITLCVLCLLLAKRLNLSVVGVGMPGHFLVKVEPDQIFVDCFRKGTFLTQADCERFLRESGHDLKPHYLQQSPNHLILARIVRNLIGIYGDRQ